MSKTTRIRDQHGATPGDESAAPIGDILWQQANWTLFGCQRKLPKTFSLATFPGVLCSLRPVKGLPRLTPYPRYEKLGLSRWSEAWGCQIQTHPKQFGSHLFGRMMAAMTYVPIYPAAGYQSQGLLPFDQLRGRLS